MMGESNLGTALVFKGVPVGTVLMGTHRRRVAGRPLQRNTFVFCSGWLAEQNPPDPLRTMGWSTVGPSISMSIPNAASGRNA